MHNQPFLCQFIDSIEGVRADSLGDLLAERSLVADGSSTIRVLILTNNYDPEANLVGIGLRNKGIDYVRLNIGDIPSRTQIRYSVGENSDILNLDFSIRKRLVDSSKVSLVWLRNFDISEINIGGDELGRIFSIQQWDNAFQTLLSNLSCEWISNPLATRQAGDRGKQLSSARAIGFDIPATLITNDPQAARDFYDYYDGDIVLKALRHHSVQVQGKVYSMYTRKILKQDLSKLYDLVHAPCILQKRLASKSELRVTVVGERVFAAELHFKSTWKQYDDIHRCSSNEGHITAFKMSESSTESCINFVKSLGLEYAAIDFIVDKNDRLIFLEVNPIGDWYWVENKINLPITETMVDLIAGFVKS